MSKEGIGNGAGRGSGGGRGGLNRMSLDGGGGGGFDAIPEDRHAPELAFRSVNPVGRQRRGVEEEKESLVKQPGTVVEQRPVHLISQSMHVPGSTNVHLRMHRLTQDDPDEEEEENDESWTTTPAVLKMTSGIQMLTLLADAVESKMPNNAKHMRETLESLKGSVDILGSQHSQLKKAAARDALTVNRHMAWANFRNNRYAALQRVSAIPEKVLDAVSMEKKKQDKQKKKMANYVQYGVLTAISLTVLIILTQLKPRLPHEEALQHAHAISSSHPAVLPLKSSPRTVIESAVTAPPWEGAKKDSDDHGDAEDHAEVKLHISLMQYIGSDELVHDSHHRRLQASDAISKQESFTFQPEDWVHVTSVQECALETKSKKCHKSFRSFNDAHSPDHDLVALVVSVEPAGLNVPVDIHLHQFGWLGDAKIWISLVVLLVVLGLIALEVIHRTLVAMMGSFIMLALLIWLDLAPDLGTVIEWIDEGALSLLFGMMILVGKLSSTGFFEVATVKVIALCKGNMWTLVVIMSLLTAVLSAFLDNVTTVLLIAPVSIQMASALHISPIPLLICEVLFSNIGGTATMIGDPPNIIIGNGLEEYIGFVDFIVALAPAVLIMAIPALFLLRFLFKGALTGRLEKYDEVLQLGKAYRIKNKKLLIQTGIVLGACILAFLIHPLHHVNVAWIAILGAVTLMLVSSPRHIHKDLEAVEWDTLLFFAALFVMVEAMGEVGLIRKIGDILIEIIEAAPEASRKRVSIVLIIWVSALVSAFLDNIPYTATMVPVVKQLASAGLGLSLEPLAWSLAFGACLGGNGSLVGASANIVVAGIAEREGYHISFLGFLAKSFPVMLLSVTIATGWMLAVM